MRYDKELFFTENLLKNFRIHLRYITEHTSEKFSSFQGIGLQDILNYKFDNASIYQMLEKQCQPNTLYRIHNIFMCHYIFGFQKQKNLSLLILVLIHFLPLQNLRY